jgi:hypothetical protein
MAQFDAGRSLLKDSLRCDDRTRMSLKGAVALQTQDLSNESDRANPGFQY